MSYRERQAMRLAQGIYARIGDGHRNAVGRPSDRTVDRALRKLIERANHNGDCIIPREDGRGYYRPIPSDPVDALEYRVYVQKETSRYRNIMRKLSFMNTAYEMR